MKSNLDLIESRLQTLIESSANLLPGSTLLDRLAIRLVDAMRKTIMEVGDSQTKVIPGIYLIHLNPVNYSAWQGRKGWIDSLTRALREAAEENDVHFSHPLALHLLSDPVMALDDLKVVAEVPSGKVEQTAAMPAVSMPQEDITVVIPHNAFLIINGKDTYALEQAVINIGRRLDNHLVIDDPRVSRAHAQLRAVRGRFALFDLNSTGGTYVNGIRIKQHILKPGDVISLAGLPIIYGEDLPPGNTGTLSDTAETDSQPPHPGSL